jgi:tetratricopeptide (TPR) repeat protein
LRATIAWSYDHLIPEAQELFRRLAVFVGGCTIDAAEAVVSELRIENEELRSHQSESEFLNSQFSTLNLLGSLVDQSLVQQVGGVDGMPRFVMFETIREYALERLVEHGEVDRLRRQHAAWSLDLAQSAEPALTGPQQQLWLDRLEQEHANLSAAIQWSLDQREIEMAIELCAALWKFWQFHCHYSLGEHWMEAALAQSSALELPLRAKVLCGAGWLAYSAGDNVRAQTLFDEGLALARALHEPHHTAMALHGAGQMAQVHGNYAQARALYEESLALFRQLADSEEIAWSLHHLGKLAREQGDNACATALFEECLALFRNVGHGWGIALAARHLGYMAYLKGDHALAREYYREALALSEDLGDTASSMWTCGCLAEMAAAEADCRRAAALFAEGLKLARDLGDNQGVSWCFAGLVRLATIERSSEQTAQLLGAIDSLLDRLDIRLSLAEQAEWERQLAGVRAQLAEATFAAAWAGGVAMRVEQAWDLDSRDMDLGIAARPLPPPP